MPFFIYIFFLAIFSNQFLFSHFFEPEIELTIFTSNNLLKKEREAAVSQINKEVKWTRYDKKIISLMKSNLKTTYLARYKDEIAGYIILDPSRKTIPYLAVSPQFQSMGVGTKLCKKAYQEAKNLGLDTISAVYYPDRSGAGELFQKLLNYRNRVFELVELNSDKSGESKILINITIDKDPQ